MNQLPLFDEAPATPPTPGQVNREKARRREWRRRQRKCRALKKWRERIALAPPFPGKSELLEAEWNIVGAVFIARVFAARAFECVAPEQITHETLRLFFQTARTVFDRGVPVTRETVCAELKRHGVLLIDSGAMIDALVDLTPRTFGVYRVQMWANELKKAA